MGRKMLTVISAVAFLLMSLIASAIVLIFDNSSTGAAVQTDEFWPEISAEAAGIDSEYMNVFYQVTGFDAERQIADVTAYFWPSPDLATYYSSSTIINTDVSVFVDEVGGAGVYRYSAGSPIGGIVIKVDATNPYELTRSIDSNYPFDEYSFVLYAQAGAGLEDPSASPLPIFEDTYTTAIPGFQLILSKENEESFFNPDGRGVDFPLVESAIEQRVSGLAMTTAIVKRNFAVKIIAMLVAIFCFIIALSLFYMTLQIMKRDRPPSMQVLVWAAANSLGLIQIRDLLPGKPRIGIAFDIYVYFPALTGTLISTVALFVLWTRREDWQL